MKKKTYQETSSTVPGSLLSPGHTATDVEQPLLLQRLGPPARVLVLGVAAVDDDVALVEQRHQLVDEGVDGGAGLDEEHDAAGLLQLGHHLLQGVGANDLGALGLVLKKPKGELFE